MTEDVTTRPDPARAGPTRPMTYLALTASIAAAALLLGGVLFAFARAGANDADASDRLHLLAQAANPFIAFLALASSGLVVHLRRAGGEHEQRAPGAALGIATAVCLAVVLLALNGVLTDLTGDAGTVFKLSAVVNRLAAIMLAGLGLWLSITAVPPKPDRV